MAIRRRAGNAAPSRPSAGRTLPAASRSADGCAFDLIPPAAWTLRRGLRPSGPPIPTRAPANRFHRWNMRPCRYIQRSSRCGAIHSPWGFTSRAPAMRQPDHGPCRGVRLYTVRSWKARAQSFGHLPSRQQGGRFMPAPCRRLSPRCAKPAPDTSHNAQRVERFSLRRHRLR